jgi:hypothetical protein
MWLKETAQGSRGALGQAGLVRSVLYTEGCQYTYLLCLFICKDLCETTKNVQQVISVLRHCIVTCSSLFLLITIIIQHYRKHFDAFVPYWHEFKCFVSAEIWFFQSHPFTNRNFHFLPIMRCADMEQVHKYAGGLCYKKIYLSGTSELRLM